MKLVDKGIEIARIVAKTVDNNFDKLPGNIRNELLMKLVAVERVRSTQIKPLKFEDTMQYKNRELYDILQ